MNILKPNEISLWIERFDSCYDGVIRAVHVRLRSSGYPTRITVVLSTQDRQSNENEGWVNLRIEMLDVEEFTFREPPNITNQIIYGGLHVGYYEGLFFVDFGFLTDEPNGLHEYRDSQFYAATRSLKWEVIPYEE